MAPASSDSPSTYVTIESMSGVFDGRSISTVVTPGFCCGPIPSDNYLYTTGGALLDGHGLAFNTSDGSNYYYYSIAFANNDGYAVTTLNNAVTVNGTFTATPQQQLGSGSPTPEPVSTGMVLAGFAAIFTTLNRRRRSARATHSGLHTA